MGAAMYFVMYKDQMGDWRWRLLAEDHQIVADSGEGYRNKGDCQHGIRLVKSTLSATPVIEREDALCLDA
ncbi:MULTISPECIES: YegP family protein [Microvirgula]